MLCYIYKLKILSKILSVIKKVNPGNRLIIFRINMFEPSTEMNTHNYALQGMNFKKAAYKFKMLLTHLYHHCIANLNHY